MNFTDVFLNQTEQLMVVLRDDVVGEMFGHVDVLGGAAVVEQCKGRCWSEFLSSNDNRMFSEFRHRILSGLGQRGESVELQVCLDTGKKVTLRLRGQGARQDDAVVLVLVATDITEEMRLKRQLSRSRRMEALGALAGGVAHDFNNILMGVIGYADMARDEVAKHEDVYRYLDHVLCGAYRARDLIRQVLQFTQPSSADTPGVITLNALLKGIGKSLKASIDSDIDVSYDIDDDAVGLDCSAEEAESVIMAVCEALMDELDDGRVHITLNSQRLDETEDLVNESGLAPRAYGVVRVSAMAEDGAAEHGFAIDCDRVLRGVFDRMTRLGGLGLWDEADEGRASIRLWFPQSEDVKTATPPAASGRLKGVGGSGRILFVDDEKILVDMVERMLSALGYQVMALTCSHEAWTLFQNSPEQFDLVITDHVMPQLTGLELATKMLEVRPDIPIVMLTAYSEKVTARQARTAGIKRYLLKPIERHELSKVIHDVLKDANKGREK